MKKIIITAGGTGGHIFPALAIGQELILKGVELHFIGSRGGMEERLCHQEKIAFTGLDVQKLYRKFTFSHLRFPIRLLKSIWEAARIIRSFHPDLMLATGGFASGPAGLAAILNRIPLFIQEQNSYPGITNRFLGKYAEKIFLGNPGAASFFSTSKVVHSGNPIRSEIITEKRSILPAEIDLKEGSFKLLILGGSQGSRSLNSALIPIIEDLLKTGIELLWQTGRNNYDEVTSKFDRKKGLWIFDFFREMGKLYNSVDAVIARAGAITLAELETMKIPAILVPLPTAAGNHQYYNALELVKKKCALLLEQKNLTPVSLKQSIMKLREYHAEFFHNFKSSPHADATTSISRLIFRRIENRGLYAG